MKKLLPLLMLHLLALTSFGQTERISVDGLFGKKWRTAEYQIGGHTVAADDIPANDGTVFGKDGSYISVDKGVATKGTWTFDGQSGMMTVMAEGSDPVLLRVLKVEDYVAVMEAVNEQEPARAREEHRMTIFLRGTAVD